jgi:aspartate/methionine/tyrosine aminotransferase
MASDGSAPFPYMRWAKANLDASDPSSLGLSGVPRPSPAAVPGLDPAPDAKGLPTALREAIARREGVDPDRVLLAQGTSHANFVTMLALARGGRFAAETPAYQSLHRTAEAIGAACSTFARRPETGGRIDPDSLARAATPGTRLLVVTDLHNPSGAALHPDDLALLVRTAERLDARVLVDEIYREFDPDRRPTAARLGDRVVVTNSLTKVHGLGDLRAGWILGAPDVLRRIAEWDDLVCPAPPLRTMEEALRYLPHADRLADATRRRAAERIEQVDRWVLGRYDVRWTRPAGGLTGFLLLGRPGRTFDGDAVAARLWEDAHVRIVPGSFFQVPAAVRISYGLEPEALARALDALGRALDRSAS